jgi:hypothetical protein
MSRTAKNIKVGTIGKYISPPEPEGTLIQAKIDPELAKRLKEKLSNFQGRKVTLVEFLEASVNAFLEEV